jgi:hypothetical protein|uniref:Uncharacterized protein n=1 Tax=Picea glauca TaxID=3330 RepID=A0A101LVE5_PICGL|nr:hypothetical protein ABT39_MTgene2163 [Picea glauca]QHR87205.1 hypothetical protein Q903MT_gene1214 [Picea sitchensis]
MYWGLEVVGPLWISELRMEEIRTTISEGGLLLAPPITLSKPDLTPFISIYKGVLLFLIQSTCFHLPHLHPPRAWREGEQLHNRNPSTAGIVTTGHSTTATMATMATTIGVYRSLGAKQR